MIAKMNSALAHRGPDDEGFYTDEKISLGHKRLSIIDLSSMGHQPMFSNDGRYCIVYNGEIYNFREIKNELPDYKFKTSSDTEIILAAYSKWGKDCLQKLNGMFAFAVWDKEKKELLVARDRLGIKPLYYFRNDKQFVFSSEIRALLSCGIIPKKIDRQSLIDYMRYQTVHAPQTIVENICMLMPGHFICISENKIEIKKYWNIFENPDKSVAKKSYTEVCRDVNSLLTKSVERRLIADVPFGAFLSGGIDSSAIVGLMSKVATEKVKTFSIVFDEGEFSEAKFSRIVSKKFNTDHHEIKLTPTDFLNELQPALQAMDHPSGDGPNTYVVSKATKNAGISMVLSGLGGDELFAGYNTFERIFSLQNNKWLKHIPYALRKNIGQLIQTGKKGVSSDKICEILNLDSFGFENTYPLLRQSLLDPQIFKLIRSNKLSENVISKIANEIKLNIQTNDSLLNKISLVEIMTYMQNVLLRDTDQMSMASALEVRVPFLDHELVQYILNVPDKYKMPITSKKLLIDALDGLIPNEVINRKKMGFTFPWKHWMKNELRTFCEEKINSLSERELFDSEEMKSLWNRFLKDDPRVTWSRLWHLVVLENWIQQNNIEA